MLCKVLAHVPGVLLPCGRGCLHYYYPMGLFLVSSPCLSSRPVLLPPTGPEGPPTPSGRPFLSGRRGPAYPDRQARESWRAGGRTPRERRLRPLTRRSLPSAPDLFLGSSWPARWAPSYAERPYVPPTKHPGCATLPTRSSQLACSLRVTPDARAPGNAFSSPPARPSYSPTAELAGASAQAQS